MVSTINERNERKIGFQVRLGVGNLPRRGPMPRRSNPRKGIAETSKFEASGSPRQSSSCRQSSLHLGRELRDCIE